MNGVKPYINLFVHKAGKSFVQKPEFVSVSKSELFKLKPVTDTFKFSQFKKLSVNDIKNLFPKGEIEADYLLKEMKRIKRGLFFHSLTSIKDFKTWIHSANLSKRLSEGDYEEIAEFMNLHKGKYIDI